MRKLIYITVITLPLIAISLQANAQIYYQGINVQSTKPPKGWKHPNGYNFYLKKLDGAFDFVLYYPTKRGSTFIFNSKDTSDTKYKEFFTSIKKKFGSPKDLSSQLQEKIAKNYDRSSGLTAGKTRKLNMWKIAPHFVVMLVNTTKYNTVIFGNKYK